MSYQDETSLHTSKLLADLVEKVARGEAKILKTTVNLEATPYSKPGDPWLYRDSTGRVTYTIEVQH